MSDNPLQRYFDTLNLFATGTRSEVNKAGDLDVEIVRGLVAEQCLRAIDTSSTSGPAFLRVSLTPHGAVMLAEWRALLDRGTFKAKVYEHLEKLVYLVAGSVIATGVQLVA